MLANKTQGMILSVSYWNVKDKVVHLLHKVGITPQELKNQGVYDEIVEAVEALERRPKEDFMKYVKRVTRNEIATRILKDEISDTLNIKNMESLDEGDLKTLNENLAALHYLKSLGKE